MNSIKALKNFRDRAITSPEDFLVRYYWTWPGLTQADVEAVWAQMVDLVPTGATHVLDLGCGNGGFAKVLRKTRPEVAITAVDVVIENIDSCKLLCVADGTITCASVASSDSVTVNGVTLTAAGAQASAGLNFDETGSDDAVASSLAAAINDAGNGLNSVVTATAVGPVVKVSAVTPGVAGNSIALASSDGAKLAVEAATLTGGVDPSDFVVAGVWDALVEAAPAWDFVTSCNCVWAYTEREHASKLFSLLNAKSARGFAVLAHGDKLPPDLSTAMAEAETASTNLLGSYYSEEVGARSTLLTSLVGTRLHPVWLQRDAVTGAVAPEVEESLCLTAREAVYNKLVAFQDLRQARKNSQPEPTTIKGLSSGTPLAALNFDFSVFRS